MTVTMDYSSFLILPYPMTGTESHAGPYIPSNSALVVTVFNSLQKKGRQIYFGNSTCTCLKSIYSKKMLNHGLGTHYTWSGRGACYGLLKVCVVWGRVGLNWDPDDFLEPATESLVDWKQDVRRPVWNHPQLHLSPKQQI